ncbi:MAG: chorismate synthase [Candidatus Marinimicrobia bacterium]|nr:chorismate synthase [Candidatus Neomarinimicrobiota bacterium]
MQKAITYITGGESHGPAMTTLIKGLPAGFTLDIDQLNYQLWRRQQGYGRGGRMKIEQDRVAVLSGLRNSMTLASPLTLMVQNNDFRNWQEKMDPVNADTSQKVQVPRPGHADYPGIIKYGFDDIRNVMERASARETTARILPGAICRQFLEALDIRLYSHIIQLGSIRIRTKKIDETLLKTADTSDVRCIDTVAAKAMRNEIDAAKAKGDSLGGIFQVIVYGLPIGLGSYVHWDDKLSSAIAAEIMGIQAIKGIEFGIGFEGASLRGSQYHDAFKIENEKVQRTSNHAGGVEGGITNGEALIFNAVMKPIPTLTTALDSFNISNMEKVKAHKERTDSCALPAAAVVAENVTAGPILNALLARYGGDCWNDIKQRITTS